MVETGTYTVGGLGDREVVEPDGRVNWDFEGA